MTQEIDRVLRDFLVESRENLERLDSDSFSEKYLHTMCPAL
jgi:hypothetical protein